MYSFLTEPNAMFYISPFSVHVSAAAMVTVRAIATADAVIFDKVMRDPPKKL